MYTVISKNVYIMMKKILLIFGIFAACVPVKTLAQPTFVYVSDAGGFSSPPWQILKFDVDGQNGEVFIDDHLAWPQDIVFLEDKDEVLISNLNNGRISRFNATTGDYINDFAAFIGGPTRMKIAADGLLYVLQWQGDGKVLRFGLDGSIEGAFTDTGVPTSIGLDWDASGNLYVSSYTGKFVRRFNPQGGDMGLFIDSELAGPTNIWFEPNGDLMVVDYNGGVVKRFNSNGELIGTFISSLPQGEGVDFLPNKNILIGSGGAHSVRVYSSTGTYIEDLVPPGTLNLLTPNAVVLRTPGTSGLPVPVPYHEMTIVTPSLGVHFQFSGLPHDTSQSHVTLYDAEGRLLKEIKATGSMSWDASDLANGVYTLMVNLPNGINGRQRVVVQH